MVDEGYNDVLLRRRLLCQVNLLPLDGGGFPPEADPSFGGKVGVKLNPALLEMFQNYFRKKALIPSDFFTTQIFENLESILARERKETSTAHPKKQYANEKNARLMLNLAMVFIQHSLQKEDNSR